MKASRHVESTSSSSLRQLLVGGDCRSIAGSNRALVLVPASPDRVAQLVALAKDADWLVSMRALDLLEKLVHDHRVGAALPPRLHRYLDAFIRSGRPALAARARKVHSRLRAKGDVACAEVDPARPKRPVRLSPRAEPGTARAPRGGGR